MSELFLLDSPLCDFSSGTRSGHLSKPYTYIVFVRFRKCGNLRCGCDSKKKGLGEQDVANDLVVVGFFFFSAGGVVVVRTLGASLFSVHCVIVCLCIVVSVERGVMGSHGLYQRDSRVELIL